VDRILPLTRVNRPSQPRLFPGEVISEHTVNAVLDNAEVKLRGMQRRLRMEEEAQAPAGYFTMFIRTFHIDAPVKTGEHGGELTDEEARPIHAAITQILDDAEVEIRRKLEAIVPTYPTQPTFKLRAR
jgi:hypothetical protein